jgi:hypothetical protein
VDLIFILVIVFKIIFLEILEIQVMMKVNGNKKNYLMLYVLVNKNLNKIIINLIMIKINLIKIIILIINNIMVKVLLKLKLKNY